MAKLKNPLHSLTADGPLGRLLTYHKYRGQAVARTHSHPKQPNTPAQIAWRTIYQMAAEMWHALSPSEKADWERVARPHHMNGFPFFMSSCLKPNPGIYLPLAGGTMTGPIAMGANKITGLGAPVDPNDAARKADLGGGTFVALTDTPAAYAGEARKLPQVNAGATALEFTKLQGANLSQTFGASALRLHTWNFTAKQGSIFQIDNCATSPFSALINGNPTDTQVIYDAEANENTLKGILTGANRWGRFVLHNTTRSNSRLIVDFDEATNTITTEASTDDWANNDVITLQSQTCAQAGYMDVDLSDELTANEIVAYILFDVVDKSGAPQGARRIILHPFTAYDAGNRVTCNIYLADEKTGFPTLFPIITQKLCVYQQNCADVGYSLSVLATLEYADT